MVDHFAAFNDRDDLIGAEGTRNRRLVNDPNTSPPRGCEQFQSVAILAIQGSRGLM